MELFATIAIVAYVLITGYLGYLGYRHTKTSADYLVAGRETHPFIMSLSYCSTFISTSAIVGFGGAAGLFGMSLLWLTFLNIFVGIFIAFIFLGGPTRRIGHRLNAHTFPELMGKRFQSRGIQIMAGLIIFLFMPMYTTAVLLGGAEFLQTMFHMANFNQAFLIMALVTAAYVLAGGLKGVMYTDAFQAVIMVGGMVILLFMTYWMLGGVTQAHTDLTALAPQVPAKLAAMGHTGWTSFPKIGWGNTEYDLWWTIVSTLVLGVGIGVLAQPQMAVRFMTVKSKKEINRAVGIGGVTILLLTGVAFTVGALSNVYFSKYEEVKGKILSREAANADTKLPERLRVLPEGVTDESKALIIPIGPKTEIIENGDQSVIRPHLISVARTMGAKDQIIPTYISQAMPKWFGVVFLLTLLSAAMSTLSSQFHAMGTAIGRDVVEQIVPRYKPTDKATILVTRIGIILGIIASILLAKATRDAIAVSTALFFGLCAAAFLPSFIGGLFWKRMTRAGALASIIIGFIVSALWMTFIYASTAKGIGLCMLLTGKPILLAAPNWGVVDPIVVALPISAIVAIVVSLMSQPPAKEHLAKCFD